MYVVPPEIVRHSSEPWEKIDFVGKKIVTSKGGDLCPQGVHYEKDKGMVLLERNVSCKYSRNYSQEVTPLLLPI